MSSAAQTKKNISHTIRGIKESPFKEKLMEMGCTPGTKLIKVHEAPFGCPMAFDVEGYHLALRKSEAETIIVD